MAIWTGAVSFGLVNIPGSLQTAQETGEKLSFKLEDKRDHSPVGYKYYNKNTGEDVDKKDIIKTYEFEKGKRVEITSKEIKSINQEASENIDIENFVPMDEIDLLLFERPYYLVPKKGAEKSYHLLRQAMEETDMCALGQVVMRQKNHLALMFPREEYIVVELLRYPHSVIQAHEANYLKKDPKKIDIPKKELDMAVKLIKNMKSKWNPEEYKDDYYEQAMKLINKKIKGKKIHVAKDVSKGVEASNVRDITALLRESLEENKKPKKKRA
ncbi:MAG: Ku protein [Bacteriovoracaceae bacterium]